MEIDREKAIDALSEQRTSILRAEQRVVKAIWSEIPLTVRLTYNYLEKKFESGQEVDSYAFWEEEKGNIRYSARGFNAKIRQTFVEDAFAELLSSLWLDRKRNTTQIFSRSVNPIDEGNTMLDIYKFEPDVLAKAIKDSDEQARQDIIKTVIIKDPLANTKMINPDPFAEGLLFTDLNIGSSEIVAPTTMKGVALKFSHPAGTGVPVVEFLLHKAA